MIFTMTGVTHVAKVVGASFDKGLNPIPKSPPLPTEMCNSRGNSVSFKNGMRFVSDTQGQYKVMTQERNSYTTFSTGDVTTINSRLNLYAACDSFTDNGTSQVRINDLCQLAFDPSTGSSTKSLLMFPQVRDLFPPNAIINSAKLVTGQVDYSQLPVMVDVFEITSQWDPRSFDASSIPSTSATPIVSGLIDLTSPNATNRTLDVTTTFNNWLDGISNQWGFMISLVGSNALGLNLDYPFRLYVDYEMPEGSYLGGSSGASYYRDGICPPLWIPRRSVYILKTGILNNKVIAGVFAATHTEPPFGYQVQSMEWIHDGRPVTQTENQPTSFSTTSVPFPMNVQTVSPYTMVMLMNSAPPVQAGMFWEGNNIGLGYKSCPVMNSIEEDNNAEDYELDSIMCPGDPPPGPPIIEDCIIPPIEDKAPEDGICDSSLPGDPDCCPQIEGTQEEGYYGTDGKSDDPPFGIDTNGDGTPDDPPFDFEANLTIDPDDIIELEQECIPFDIGVIDPIGGDFIWPPETQPTPDPVFPPWGDEGFEIQINPPPGRQLPSYSYNSQPVQWTMFDSGSVWSYGTNVIDTSDNNWMSQWTRPSRTTKPRLLGSNEGSSFSAENYWIRSGAPYLYSMDPGSINPIPIIPIISPIDGRIIGAPPKINFPELICAFPIDITDDSICGYVNDWEAQIEDYLEEDITINPATAWGNICETTEIPDDGDMVIMGDTLPQVEYTVADETDLSIFDPRSGQTSLSTTDFKIVCHGGVNLSFTRNYAGPLSTMAAPTSMGIGWMTNLDESITIESDSRLNYVNPSGYCVSYRIVYSKNNQMIRLEGPEGYEDKVELEKDAQGIAQGFKIISANEKATKHYDKTGKLLSLTTDTGGSLTYNRNGSGFISSISDDYSGRSLNFTYDGYGRITSVSAPENRNWTYTYDSNGNLIKATNPRGDHHQYEYNNIHLMTKVINPRGYTVREFEYESGSVYSKIVKVIGMKENPTDSPIITKVSYFKDKKSFPYIQSVLDLPFYMTNSVNTSTDVGDERFIQTEDPEGRKSYLLLDRIGREIAIAHDDYSCVLMGYQYDSPYSALFIADKDGNTSAWVEEDENNNQTLLYDATGEAQTVTTDEDGRVTQTEDREGKISTFIWSADKTKIEQVISPLGLVTYFNYDQNNNLISVTEPYKTGVNKTTTYGYDSNGYINSITDPEGNTTQYTYNDCGDLVSVTNALGKLTTLTLDKMGFATSITGPAPGYRTLTRVFDECNNLISTTNPRGYTHTFTFNKNNQMTESKNALNQKTTFEYDKTGNLISQKDDKGNETTCEYDNCGRIIRMTDAEGTIASVEYDENGNIKCYKNTYGDEICNFEYDELDRLQYTDDALGSTTTYERDKENHITKVISPLGMYTELTYDDAYRVIKVKDNAGNETHIEYWPSGQVKKTTDPLGNETLFDYDKNGNITTVTNDLGHSSTTVYDALNRPTSTTDPLNNTTTIAYNLYGLVSSVTDPLNNSITFEYDSNNNLLKKTSAEGLETEWEYDALDRMVKVTTPMDFVYEKTYDNVGNLTELENPLGHLQQFQYTDDYKVSKYIDQINNETDYAYDEHGRLMETTRPEGDVHTVNYDKVNNITSYWDPNDTPAYYMYNEAGSLVAKYLPDLTKTNGDYIGYLYHYDNLGRRTGFTDDAGKLTTSTLDALGRVTQLSNPNGKSIGMTYDSLGRMTDIDFNGGESIDYVYDALSRLISETDGHGTKSIAYDACSRVTNVTDHFGDQYSYTYDDDGRQLTTTTPLGTSTSTYDDDGRVTGISLAGGGNISNTYDNASRLITSSSPNTTITTNTFNNANLLTQKNVSTSILYMSLNDEEKTCVETELKGDDYSFVESVQYSNPRIIENLKDSGLSGIDLIMEHSKRVEGNLDKTKPVTLQDIINAQHDYQFTQPNSPNIPITTVANFTYTYDDNYNILSRVNPAGTESFTYDNCDRLTQAIMPNGTYTYTYDLRSNITTKRFVNTAQTVDETSAYTYSIDDRLTSYTVTDNLTSTVIKSVTYTYDDAGCMLTKAITVGGTTNTTSYTYYDDLRIKTVTLPDTTTVTYTYGADGNRSTKTTSTEYVKYYYNGGTLVKEVHMDASNHSTILFTVHYEGVRYIYDPGTPGGNDEVEYYPITDMSGTVHLLLDDTASIVGSYTYSPFGEMLTNSSPTIFAPFGYAGTYADSETGLLFANSRYYDPVVARFTTKDSYRGSKTSLISQNRYIYCHQNPIKFVDPSGFAPVGGPFADPLIPLDNEIYYEPGEDILTPPSNEAINSPMNVQAPNSLEAVADMDSEDLERKKQLEERNPGYTAYKVKESGYWTLVPDGVEPNGDGTWTESTGDGSVRIRIAVGSGYNVHDPCIVAQDRENPADRAAAEALRDALFHSGDMSDSLLARVMGDGTKFTNLLDTIDERFNDGTYDSFAEGLGIDYGGFIWATCGAWLTMDTLRSTNGGGDTKITIGENEDGTPIEVTLDEFVDQYVDGYGGQSWETWCLDYGTADMINWSKEEYGSTMNRGEDYEYTQRRLLISYSGDMSNPSLNSPAGLLQITQINMAESILVNGSDLFSTGYADNGEAALSNMLSATAILVGLVPGGSTIATGLSITALVVGALKDKNPDLLTQDMIKEVVKSMGWDHNNATWGPGGAWSNGMKFYSGGKGQVMAHSRYKMLMMYEYIGFQSRNGLKLGHLGCATEIYLNSLAGIGDTNMTTPGGLFASIICATVAGADVSGLDTNGVVNSKWFTTVWGASTDAGIQNWLGEIKPMNITYRRQKYNGEFYGPYLGSSTETMTGGTSGTSGSGSSGTALPELSGIQIGIVGPNTDL